MRTDFRRDINGLRTWAVLLVVLFHFKIPGFERGFLGVDIFFVISGLLMTKIVSSQLAAGKDITDLLVTFYLARARRIYPALVVLCITLLAAAWFCIGPLEYAELAREAFYSLTFLSNFKFWSQAGYFDTASREKWLLHTWSLSVEWQFYLLLPLALAGLWKFRKSSRVLYAGIAIMLTLSFATAVFKGKTDPSAAFYLLPSRAWELLAGGILALLPPKQISTKRAGLTEWCGIACMTLALIPSFEVGPSSFRFAVVVGAALVLSAERFNSAFTCGGLAQWLGSRSYSIYLWHWPVVVAMAYFGWDSFLALSLGILSTFVFGHLSYVIVEQKSARALQRLRPPQLWTVVLCGIFPLLMTAHMLQLSAGVPSRFSPVVQQAEAQRSNMNPRRATCHIATGVTSPSCVFGGGELKAILLGDSHAMSLATALSKAVPDRKGGVMAWTYSACPTLFGVHTIAGGKYDRPKCALFLDWALARLNEIPPSIPIVIANRYALYVYGPNEDPGLAGVPTVFFTKQYLKPTSEFLDEFTQHLVSTACRLTQGGRKVFFVRPVPEMATNVPSAAVRRLLFHQNPDISITRDEYTRRQAHIIAAENLASELCGVTMLDPTTYLCSSSQCYGATKGKVLYADDNHLSEDGAEKLIRMFRTVFWEGDLINSTRGGISIN